METSVNNKCKSFTSLEQSKKLSEILPLESADMHYNNVSIKGINYVDEHRAELMEYNRAIKVLSKYTINPLFEVVPCWSLAALLRELPDTMLGKDKDGYVVMVETMGSGLTSFASNPIDACYEMIIKLHEQKLL